jgi:hypothetical protein
MVLAAQKALGAREVLVEQLEVLPAIVLVRQALYTAAVVAAVVGFAAGLLAEVAAVSRTALFVLFGVLVALVEPHHSHQLMWGHK